MIELSTKKTTTTYHELCATQNIRERQIVKIIANLLHICVYQKEQK